MKETIACSMLPVGSKWRLVAHLEEITSDEQPQLSGEGGYLISSFLSAIHNAAKQIASAEPKVANAEKSDKCNCGLATRLVGDGCQYCNPQLAIGLLKEQLEDARLTDEERVDVAMWLHECLRQCSLATDGGNEEVAERWNQRAKRAAALLDRIGGE